MAGTSEAAPLSIATRLYDHYEGLGEGKHYYGLLAIYALARTAESAADDALWHRVETILRRFPDRVQHPHYNFPSYRIGGIAQAFVVSTGRMPDRLGLVGEYAEELMAAPRDTNGILTMINQPGDKIWIDVAMAATPYLLYAGLALAEPRYLAEAVHQTVAMYDLLLDRDLGLLHQCINFVAPGVRSQDHWSRGNGWGYFALAELVRGLPADAPGRAEVERRYLALTAALRSHQTPSGLWRQEIPLATSWEESSGTGLIGYGLGAGIAAGVLDPDRHAPPLRSALHGLARHAINDDFSTEWSCPGTLCPGDGPAKGSIAAYVESRAPHRDEPHGCGPIMLALTLADQAGVDRLDLRNPVAVASP